MKVEVVEAKMHWCGQLIRRLRPENYMACVLLGVDGHRELRAKFMASARFRKALLIDGELIGMWGCTDSLGDPVGRVWAAFSRDIERYPLATVRACRDALKQAAVAKDWLETTIPEPDTTALRFAEFMDFRRIGRVRVGAGYGIRYQRRPLLEIQKCPFSEIEGDPDFPALLAEYAMESGNKVLPIPKCHAETYQKLESVGLLHVYAARSYGALIGFIFVVVGLLPHYSQLLGNTESFFVAKAHRKTGAGMRLLAMAEASARDAGAQALLVSAPYGGDLSRVLPHRGYTECSRAFAKRLSDG